MASREDVSGWLIEALQDHGGAATIVQICKHIWAHHEAELRHSGDLFYTWQYDVRWAANRLRRARVMMAVEESEKGRWRLAPKSMKGATAGS